MSSVASLRGGIEGACVLDAFAGSGALGIEALSRGAASAVFCERDRNALKVLCGNLSDLGVLSLPDVAVRKGCVFSRPPVNADRPYDMVFLDPPYATEPAHVLELLDALEEGSSLAWDTVISYEHSAADRLPGLVPLGSAVLRRIRSKCFGDTVLDLYRKVES